MKTAADWWEEYWGSRVMLPYEELVTQKKELWDSIVEGIRDETKDEAIEAVYAPSGHDLDRFTQNEVARAIRAIGKPRFQDGQLVTWQGSVTDTRYVGRWEEQSPGTWGGRERETLKPVLLNGHPIIINDDGSARIEE